ncbi:hypothetical protein HRR80_009470 [Exophiala dermatitidis]|uniref:Alpha/beta hydrolase fold-3 domain-containing protein n=1 Tax=Exophiala dermatitidis TaxID=5970 RepID=A0AAN6EJI8_EXODE|nr:hypothetical protein HRR77_009439 [Exophiala dermatitidis]KAJ4540432.1 hypothetical protein HRR76_003832 [Exophiala dermatitidis]KAJ4553300.1 hypothetical protein HRR79_009666 [Exophiala dermatitidis]KAJ4563138.1 hypothetical protein HRR82_009479 [Exophiala dermatitidis]KAJ4609788.1 hypothetical protein HRR85_006524 [Exophiala dermatitidis]
MAPHSTVEDAASLQTLSIDSKDGLSPREKVFVYQHLPQISDTMIESYDRDFVQVMQGMDIKWEKMPSPLDFQAWREYDRTEYHNYDREVHCKRTRTKVPVTVTKVLVSYGENNEFGIHVFEPQHEDAGARPAVLMYHGGGWSHGDPNIDAELSKFFASELRAVVFGVDYRLAPEHNILTIHEDAYQALEWVIKNAEKYSIDSGRIALWGCSAGGHLAATVAMRDAKEHNPSRLSQVNLVVPALCHIDAYDEVLKAVVLAKLKVYVPTQQDEAIQFLRYVFGKLAPSAHLTELTSPVQKLSWLKLCRPIIRLSRHCAIQILCRSTTLRPIFPLPDVISCSTKGSHMQPNCAMLVLTPWSRSFRESRMGLPWRSRQRPP